MKTLIITPFLNEENVLKKHISSILAQTHVPIKWILVDDGSTDKSNSIVMEYSEKIEWITLITKNNKNLKRNIGSKIIRAFNTGLETVDKNEYDLILKLDADIVLPDNYLEEIIRHFNSDKRVGLCGGVCILDSNEIEKVADLTHLRGALKAYRIECFNEIDGLMENMGWDSVDEYKARFLNWKVKVIPDLKAIHLRKTNSEISFTKAGFKNGKMLYKIRARFIVMMTNAVKRLFWKPYLIQGLALFYGFMYALVTREKKIVDVKLGKYIRSYRYKKILEKFNL